jgi:metalloendopeptidase OMA1, mitochondrial
MHHHGKSGHTEGFESMYLLKERINGKSAITVLGLACSLFFVLALLQGCSTVPITGRTQLLLVPESEEIALGSQAYQQVLAKDKNKISTDPKINSMVTTIGRRIAAVADKPDYNWQFTVIKDDKTANAFCLPGGKVVVYTGILPYTKDEAGLAFVIAHEVGHALARHGGERMSQQLLVQLGQEGLDAAVASKSPAAVGAIDQGYGIASQVGILLPFSRSQESEADHIGLILMAEAGYDPRHAPTFFESMLKQSKNQAPPEFLSTHPADQTRIQQIKRLLPEALAHYHPR